jgi:capsular polysaccharide transport system permease protein
MEPLIFTAFVTALWNLMRAPHPGISVTGFAVTGYSSVLLWRNTVNRCTTAITPNISLMYHRNVRVIDIFAARVILEESGATIAFMILSLLFSFLGMMSPPADILTVFFGWVLLCWFGASLGLLMGALSERSELIEKFWHPLSYVMFPLSGAAFMVDWLPPAYREMVLWLPMVHGVELLREGFFGAAVRAHYDIWYMAVFCLCQTLVGLALIRDAISHLEHQ